MINTQLWIAVAIPSVFVIIFWVLVIMVWIEQAKSLARIEMQFDTVAGIMDAGFSMLNKTMNEGFEQANEHLRSFGKS